MRHIDFTERRKLRQPAKVTAGGHTYRLTTFLPAELMSVMFALGNSQEDPAAGTQAVHDLFALLFGEKDAGQAMKDISLAEATALLTEVGQTTAGESPASVKSSRTTGTRSRPTSPVSISST
jgi:hypothetical protein